MIPKESNMEAPVRTITDHIVEGDLPQNQLIIKVTDAPGPGGANHRYEITGFSQSDNPSWIEQAGIAPVVILFQNGPIKEAGLNGITQEVLLAIVIDRLRSFQNGPFACVSNQTALVKCKEALDALKFRTACRLARGVEGKTQA